jgi:hypothetical protein
MQFVSMLIDAFVELDNAPLGDDYDKNIENYENSELGAGNDSNDKSGGSGSGKWNPWCSCFGSRWWWWWH